MKTLRTGLAYALSFGIFAILSGCADLLGLVDPPDGKDKTPPAEVSGLSLTAGNGLLTAVWVDPADPDLASLDVLVDGAHRPVAKGVQTLTISGLTNGTAYTVVVKAVDSSGNASAGVGKTATPAAPSSNETFTVSFDSNGGSEIAAQTGIDAGGLANYPEEPTKSGWAFAGWFSDNTLSTGWNFESDEITANRTLYARWGSAAAVGVWFGMQDALDASIDASVDDTESILVFQPNGTYSFFQRRHAALEASTWTTLDEDRFYEVKRGRYYWNPGNNTLTFRPKKVDVIRLSLLSGRRSEEQLTSANPHWATSVVGLKTLSEAQELWGSTDWSEVSTLFEDEPFAGAGNGTEAYAEYEGTAKTLFYGTEVWQETYLDTVNQETRGGFRSPRANSDFPVSVQPLLPVLPSTPKVASLTVSSPSDSFLYGFTNGNNSGTPYYLPIPLNFTISGLSTVEYRLNGGTWMTATSGMDLSPAVKSKFGVNNLEVRGLNGAGVPVVSQRIEFFYFDTSNGDDGGTTGEVYASWSSGGTLNSPSTNQSEGTVGVWGSSSAGGSPSVSGGFVSLANQTGDVPGTALWTDFSNERTTLPTMAGLFLPVRDLPYLVEATDETQNYLSLAFESYKHPRFSQVGAMLRPGPGSQYTVMLYSTATDTSTTPNTTTFDLLGGSSNYGTFEGLDWTPPSWTVPGDPSRYTMALVKDGTTYWGLVVDRGSITVDGNNVATNHATIVTKVRYEGTVSVPDADVLGLGVGLMNRGTVPTRFPAIMAMWK